MCGDGRKSPFYVSTTNAKLPEEVGFDLHTDNAIVNHVPILLNKNKKNLVPAERAMLKYLFFMVEIVKFFEPGAFHLIYSYLLLILRRLPYFRW